MSFCDPLWFRVGIHPTYYPLQKSANPLIRLGNGLPALLSKVTLDCVKGRVIVIQLVTHDLGLPWFLYHLHQWV